MNKYTKFCEAVNNMENPELTRYCGQLIWACQRYFSAECQYGELKKVNSVFTQLYNFTEKKGLKIKKDKLPMEHRMVLNFCCNIVCLGMEADLGEMKEELQQLEKEYKRQDISDIRKKRIKDDITEKKRRIAEIEASKKNCLIYVMQNRETMLRSFCYPKFINVAEKVFAGYEKLLRQRAEANGAVDYLSEIKASDIDMKSIEECIGILDDNKTRKTISAELAFNSLISEKYVDELIEGMPIFQQGLVIKIAPIRMQLTNREIKTKSSYYKSCYVKMPRNSFYELDKKTETIIKKYGELVEKYHKMEELLQTEHCIECDDEEE